MLFFSARCECFDNAASSQCKESLKRPSSVLQTFHRKGSIPRICCKLRDSDGAWRMVDMMIIDATKRSLSNRQACIVIQLRTLGKVAGTRSVPYEDGITEHTAYDVRLDTVSVIEANISKYPCS